MSDTEWFDKEKPQPGPGQREFEFPDSSSVTIADSSVLPADEYRVLTSNPPVVQKYSNNTSAPAWTGTSTGTLTVGGDLNTQVASLRNEVKHLRFLVESLIKGRKKPGRKPKLLVEEARYCVDVCALDPDSDSSECESSGVYRYQQGCRGTACVAKHSAYYAERSRLKQEQAATDAKSA